MREHPGFWVACRIPEARLGPLTVSIPGLGEALAVFCFEEEAMLYLDYGNEDLHPHPVTPDELMWLMLGPWSRFELVTLDPMPQGGAGVMLRLASMHRDDFLNHLVDKHGLVRWECDDDTQPPEKWGSSPGLVGGPPVSE